MILPSEEKTIFFRIPEVLNKKLCQLRCGIYPFPVKSCFVKLNECVNQVRIVIRIGWKFGSFVFVTVQQHPFGCSHVVKEETNRLNRSIEISFVLQDTIPTNACIDH